MGRGCPASCPHPADFRTPASYSESAPPQAAAEISRVGLHHAAGTAIKGVTGRFFSSPVRVSVVFTPYWGLLSVH